MLVLADLLVALGVGLRCCTREANAEAYSMASFGWRLCKDGARYNALAAVVAVCAGIASVQGFEYSEHLKRHYVCKVGASCLVVVRCVA